VSLRSGVKTGVTVLALAAILLGLGSCSGRAKESAAKGGKRVIVVTYSILGSVVRDLVGDSFEVSVSIPDGLDPHEWEPSARDIERINGASLVVENGLGLEEGMQKALAQARTSGLRVFTASQELGARGAGKDPHLWTDPLAMKAVVDALARRMGSDFGLDLSARRADLDARLDRLDAEVSALVAKLPPERRVLVTGHDSLGFFARRYGFTIVGALVPSLSSQAESSAAELSALKAALSSASVPAIFVEAGSNPAIARSLASDAGVREVPLAMHALPKGGGYSEYILNLARTITGALQP
jgi:zinc/manganese transport system substrate-binding protein